MFWPCLLLLIIAYLVEAPKADNFFVDVVVVVVVVVVIVVALLGVADHTIFSCHQ